MSFDIMLAQRDHIHEWMSLVNMVEDYFPGLNKEDYRKTLEECIEKREAICVKVHSKIVGILLFSIEHNLLAFMAVHPEFRKRGIASAMIEYMASLFPAGEDIWVTTYRDGDPQGESARALYLRCGFEPDKLVIEMDYPCQKFVLRKK